MKNKIVALIMSLMMVTCFIPTFAFADDVAGEDQGEPEVTEEVVDQVAPVLETDAMEVAGEAQGEEDVHTFQNENYYVDVYMDGEKIYPLPSGVTCTDKKIILDGAHLEIMDIGLFNDAELEVRSDSTIEYEGDKGGAINLLCENYHKLKISGKGTLSVKSFVGIVCYYTDLYFDGAKVNVDSDIFGIVAFAGSIHFNNSRAHIKTENESEAMPVLAESETKGELITLKNCKEINGYHVYEKEESMGESKAYAEYFVKDADNTPAGEVDIVPSGASSADSFRATASGKKAIQLAWPAMNDADKYVVYGAKCGKKYSKIAEVTATNYLVAQIGGKNLKKKTAYKFYVQAFKDGSSVGSTYCVHAYTTGYKGGYGNVKSITAKTKSMTVAVGKTSKKAIKVKTKRVKGKRLMPKSHGPKYRYASSNPSVAKVTKKGKVKGVSAGNATIYTYTINGFCCTTAVTVK